MKKHFERLPTYIIPRHYSICLTTVDLEKHTFEGHVTVDVIVNEATKTVKLNASELVLSEVIFHGEKQLVKNTDVNVNADDETVDILFESLLEVGEGTLSL